MFTRYQSRQQQSCAVAPAAISKISQPKAKAKNSIDNANANAVKKVSHDEKKLDQFLDYVLNSLKEFKTENNYNNKVILITKIYSKINDEITDIYPLLSKREKGNKLFLIIYSQFIVIKDEIKNSKINNLLPKYDSNLLNECINLLEKTREKLIPIFKNLKNPQKYISQNIIQDIQEDIKQFEKSYYLRPYKIVNYHNEDEDCDIPGDHDYNQKSFVKKEVATHLYKLRNNKKLDYCEIEVEF
jgi:hypothetical protein